jgi:tetratricopeptide (TPR) repeat protein
MVPNQPLAEQPQLRGAWLRAALLAAAAALAAYANAIPCGLVQDDRLVLIDARVHGRTGLAEVFLTDYWGAETSAETADLYRPLTILSFRFNHALFGPSPAAYHAVNVVQHALVSALAVLLLGVLFRSRRLALASGLLFALHPVHTEAVTGVVGRAELQAAGFLLAALILHARGYRVGSWRPRACLAAALVCLALALLSKESVAVAPGLVLLVDGIGWLGRGRAPDARELRRALGVAGLYAAVVLAYLGLRMAVLGGLGIKPLYEVGLLFGEPFTARLWTGLEILAIYLRLLLFPLALSADYSVRQVPVLHSPAHPAALAGLLAAAGLATAALYGWRRRALPLLFGLGFFAIGYALVSNLLTPIGVLVAERLIYLPSLGFCVALAWVWERADAKLGAGPGARPHVAAAAALGIVLAFYGARTVLRNRDWRDPLTLFAATVAASPESASAHYNYAATLYQEKNDPAGALPHLERALEIRPKFLPAHLNAATAYLQLGRPEEARAAALRGLEIFPGDPGLRQRLQLAGELARAKRPRSAHQGTGPSSLK